MPFSIRKSDNKFQVVNSDTGDVKGTHDSEADAKKQLAALNANVPDAKKQWDNDIHLKSIEATIEDTTTDESGPGEFTVALSTPDLDRDGDELLPEGWELPLPEHITFVNDHTHRVASVVGSAKPVLEGDQIICRGTYATTQNGQDTRALVKGRHITNVSVAYREKHDGKRELINGSFVVVPSNTHARVLSSKSLEDKDVLARFHDLFTEMKGFLDGLLAKDEAPQEFPTPEEPPVPAADSAVEDEAKTLALLKAKALTLNCNHQFD